MTDNPEKGYDFPCFSFDTEKCVVLNTAYIITSKKENIKYLLGILNSKIGNTLVKFYVSQLQQRQYRMLSQFVNEFPIPKFDKEIQLKIEVLTNKLLKESDITIENEINSIIYKCYNFNQEEIIFIENN